MNDMKIEMEKMTVKYKNLLTSSIPIYKYNLLCEKYNKIAKNTNGCSVLLEHTLSQFDKINNSLSSIENRQVINKIEFELLTLQDILDESGENKV